jgi:hypothetical protein
MNTKIIREFNKLILKILYDIDNNINTDHKNNIYRLSSIKKSLQIIKKYNKKIKNGDDILYIKGIGKG